MHRDLRNPYTFPLAFWASSLALILPDLRSGKISRRSRDPPFSRPSDDPRDDDAESVLSRPVNRASSGQDDDDGVVQSPSADSNRYRAPTAPSAERIPRSSMDTYGAFSDPAPSGYPASAAGGGRASSVSPTRSGGSTLRPATSSPRLFANNPCVPPAVSTPPRLPTLSFTTPSTPPSYPPSYTTEPKHVPLPPPNPNGMSRTMALAYEDTGTTVDSAGYEDPYERVRNTVGRSAPASTTRDGLPGCGQR